MTDFLNLKETLAYRHRSRSSHFRDIENGRCTTAIKVGPKSVFWLSTELETLRAAVIAGKSEDEIRLVVSELHQARQTSFLKQTGETE